METAVSTRCARPTRGAKAAQTELDEVDETREIGHPHDAVGDRRGRLPLVVPLGAPYVDRAHAHGRRPFDVGTPRVTDEQDLTRIVDSGLFQRALVDAAVGLSSTSARRSDH